MTSRLRILSPFILCGLMACSQPPTASQPPAAASAPAQPQPAAAAAASAETKSEHAPLVDATMSMVAAAEVPDNPLTDPTLEKSPLGTEIRWGFRLFTNTPVEARRLVPGRVSCSNCHLNAGQRDRGLPVVGIAGAFPEYNKRAGRSITLTDRVVECFLRSENATGKGVRPEAMPSATTPEVRAIASYLTWLGRGYRVGASPQWRGQNAIAATAQIPLPKLDLKKGELIFRERCAACHGPEGQGILVGDRSPAPLWGPDSWNDGAGAARVYTLAGIIRYTMPYVSPGSLTDEESQQVAAYITSKPRPAFPHKAQDYPKDPVPVDAVYYRRK